MIRRHLLTACIYTAVTAFLLGVVYPLSVTGIAHVIFPEKAQGQLLVRNGHVVGSAILGQPFTGPEYFHSRPSDAGSGYDAASSGGSNLAPSSSALASRVAASVEGEKDGNAPVPVDLVTTSASGLDPDITPAAALYQVPRVAQQRGLPVAVVRAVVEQQIAPRQFGLLGEPHVNVLALNLKLESLTPHSAAR